MTPRAEARTSRPCPSTAKICGLSTPEAVDAALAGGAGWLGFVFFPKSPRAVTAQAAARLSAPVRGAAKTVAVMVDPTDAELDRLTADFRPDLIQLHGAETPGRAAEIRARTGVGIIKALPVSSANDIDRAAAYEGAVDHLMFDASPPEGSDLPGGVGRALRLDPAGRTVVRTAVVPGRRAGSRGTWARRSRPVRRARRWTFPLAWSAAPA